MRSTGRSERIAELARDLDLVAFLDRPFGRLSAGQKTRVLLAKALINEPELLLLDEPTASLDPDTADQLRGHLERYQARDRGHRPPGLAQHGRGRAAGPPRADAAAGPLVDQGSPAELLARYGRDDLEDVFLDIARDRRRPVPPGRVTPALPPPCAASAPCCAATATCCWAPGRACSISSTGLPCR